MGAASASRRAGHWHRRSCLIGFALLLFVVGFVHAGTRQEEIKALQQFKAQVGKPDALDWPDKGDPCEDKWPHITCGADPATGDYYINSLLLQDLGLGGTMPTGLGALGNVLALYFGGNNFKGAIPNDIAQLSTLQQIGLDNNQLNKVPAGLFKKMGNLQRLYLLANEFNGEPLPDLSACTGLQVLDLTAAGFGGNIPTYMSQMTALVNLSLAMNNLEGNIPSAAFQPLQASLNAVYLNNNKLTGPIPRSLGQIPLLTKLWLHGNDLTGPIPDTIGGSFSLLRSVRLNSNRLSGIMPENLGESPVLNELNVADNQLRGTLPTYMVNFGTSSYKGNGFCNPTPGVPCSEVTNALLAFLGDVGYPANLMSTWTGDNPCAPPWIGIGCDEAGNVRSITLANQKLTGELSDALTQIKTLELLQLPNNNLSGPIPPSFAKMNLKAINVQNNHLTGVLPKFAAGVVVVADGNDLKGMAAAPAPAPEDAPAPAPEQAAEAPAEKPLPHKLPVHAPAARPRQPQHKSQPRRPVIILHSMHPPPARPVPPPTIPPTFKQLPPQTGNEHDHDGDSPAPSSGIDITAPAPLAASQASTSSSSSFPTAAVVVSSVLVPLLIAAAVLIFFMQRKREGTSKVGNYADLPLGPKGYKGGSGSISRGSLSVPRGFSSSLHAGGMSRATSVAGDGTDNLLIPIDVIRIATKDFAPENAVGRGGFGTVYRGMLDDGTLVAVKRMSMGHLTTKGIMEFESEITVLSKLRHRHLVNLIGYCVDGYERLLVYEFMPKGALSRHLFDYRRCSIPPLNWQQRMSIAIDVARGMEYLHSLAHASFIHRDLKPSNVLLDDNCRAKISDFGLVKPSDGIKSIETRLAGTFGYLAPEYAVTGKVTTKSDVYSFGVILMELVTGRRALDETQSEESVHLATWLPPLISDRSKLAPVVDPALHSEIEALEKPGAAVAATGEGAAADGVEEMKASELFKSICAVADIALHCTAREPRKRPAMGDVVAMLLPHIQQWRPQDPLQTEAGGIDMDISLADAIQQWKEMGEEEDVPAAYYHPDLSGNLGRSFAGATAGSASVTGHESFMMAPAQLSSGPLKEHSFSSVGSGVRWTNLLEEKQGEVRRAVQDVSQRSSPMVNRSFYGSGPMGDVELPSASGELDLESGRK